MRKLGVPVMTLRMAAKKGIHDIYHLNKGVGDALVLAGVMREFYKKTGERPLVYVPQWNIFRYFDFCYFLWDWRLLPENVKNAKHTMDVFYIFYTKQLCGNPLKLKNGYTFNLKPKEYLHSVYSVNNLFVKAYGGFPSTGQMAQIVADRCDLTGEINIKPEIRLNDYEKEFGKFAEGKIVIKCGGNEPYKYINPKIAQGIINELAGEYEFLQVGDFEDPVLGGAEQLFKLNMREFASVLMHARMFVGPISGMMHLARAVDCPAVILHGCEHDGFYYPSQRKVFSEHRCTFCSERCWWPDNEDERRCINRYRCVTDFDAKRIANIIREEMKKPRELAALPDLVKCVGHIIDCNTTMNWWFGFNDFITDFEWPTASDDCRLEIFSGSFDYSGKQPDYSKYSINSVSGKMNEFKCVDAEVSYVKTIVSDNPLLIKLVPRPSYFAYVAKIADMQRKWTEEWHKEEPIDDTNYWKNKTEPKPEYKTLEGYAKANHMMNFFLWHTEDIARRKDVSDSVIADAKRKIDVYNQLRNDFAEKMDETMNLVLEPDLPGAFKAPINTESIGMVLDRLSILALKIYHMEEASHKKENFEKCSEKLRILKRQRNELLDATKVLFVDFLSGARQPRAYYQHKMYNDPKLNPQLAGK